MQLELFKEELKFFGGDYDELKELHARYHHKFDRSFDEIIAGYGVTYVILQEMRIWYAILSGDGKGEISDRWSKVMEQAQVYQRLMYLDVEFKDKVFKALAEQLNYKIEG